MFDEELANYSYFILTHENFSDVLLNESDLNVVIEKLLVLLNKMLDNPVALYSSNYDCYASSEKNPAGFNVAQNVKAIYQIS